MHNKTFYTQTKNFHSSKFAQTKMWHVQKLHLCFCAQCRFVISAFGKNFALQICAFCARRFFAHLHICTFTHLHICTFVNLHAQTFFYMCRFVKIIFLMCAFMNFIFCAFFAEFSLFVKICQNLEKVEISENVRFCPVGFWRVPENVRKKLTCSWVVHEWFLGQRVWQHRVAKVARICIN